MKLIYIYGLYGASGCTAVMQASGLSTDCIGQSGHAMVSYHYYRWLLFC